jgi:hypothetical protein
MRCIRCIAHPNIISRFLRHVELVVLLTTYFDTAYKIQILQKCWLDTCTGFYYSLYNKVFEYHIVISTGLTVWELEKVAFIYEEITPSKTIQLNDVTTRYILLEQLLSFVTLPICEVKVYSREGMHLL